MGACFLHCPLGARDGIRFMSHATPLLLGVLLLAGCATTPGTSYYYDGDGDYYYGDGSADLVIDAPRPSWGGYGSGWGYGYGYGGGFGYGPGYGFGGYGGFHPSWYYGYPVYPWWLWSDHHDDGMDRVSRLQHDRALRSGVLARPTIQAPVSARRGRFEGPVRQQAPLLRRVEPAPRRFDGPAPRGSPGTARPAPQRSAPSAAPAPRHSAPVMRSAPPPPPSRKQ